MTTLWLPAAAASIDTFTVNVSEVPSRTMKTPLAVSLAREERMPLTEVGSPTLESTLNWTPPTVLRLEVEI